LIHSYGILNIKTSLNDASLLSNGTHSFKKTVLLVSLDGLRYFDSI
jgi:predicted AlkP superfamily pyrophosphatase or phosphodiesterase